MKFLSVIAALLLALVLAKEEPTLDLTPASTFGDILPSEECLKEMRLYLTPSHFKNMTEVFTSSGKNINDMGDFQFCSANPAYKSIVITIIGDYNFYIRFGIWSAGNCRSKYDFAWVANFVNKNIRDLNYNFTNIETSVNIVDNTNAKKASPGTWVFVSIICLFLTFALFGIIVQYTAFGDIQVPFGVDPESVPIEKRKGKLELFFYCFNPFANLLKIFTVQEGGDQTLTVLNGVRVLSIWWVIVGQSFSYLMIAPVQNFQTVTDILEDKSIALVEGWAYAVDTFFFLSGFLSFHLLTAKAYKRNGKMNLAFVYFHRYYRLIFPVLFITFFVMYVFPFLGFGPIYRWEANRMFASWDQYWWTNLLFINNLIPFTRKSECIGWLWYLANDFQFFLMTPPIIYAYCKNRKVGYLVAALLVVISMVVNGALTLAFNVSVLWGSADMGFNGNDSMVTKPWSRMGVYFVGGMLGLSFFEYTNRRNNPAFCSNTVCLVYDKIQESRLISILLFIGGIALTSLYIVPLGLFLADCGQVSNW